MVDLSCDIWDPTPKHPIPMRSLLCSITLLLVGTISAQYNSKGKFHLALGPAIGGHATLLDQRFVLFGLELAQEETSAAATATFPIELGFGLGGRFALGLMLEPGRYVPDSANADNQTNALAIVALQPRFYIVNKERFAWMASLQLGSAALRIQDDTPNAVVDERYAGAAFGLGTGLGIGFGDKVGLEFHLRYLATRMELRAREFNDRSTMDVYKATLSTGGVVAQLSLAFRFGGN
jgi:hypothetical protein